MLKQSHVPKEKWTSTRHQRVPFLKDALLDLLALSKIDEDLDECETTNDVLAQRAKLLSRLALQKPGQVKSTASSEAS